MDLFERRIAEGNESGASHETYSESEKERFSSPAKGPGHMTSRS
jgi:hypothetical protein